MNQSKSVKVYLRIVHSGRDSEVLVAVCDAGLLGKTFRQGRLRLEVKAEFYGGRLGTIEDAMEALAGASIANLVGDDVVGAAVRRGFVNPEAVIRFEGVPHVQIVCL